MKSEMDKVVINDPVVFKFDVRSRENRSRTTSTIIVNKKNAIYIVSIFQLAIIHAIAKRNLKSLIHYSS